MSVSGSIKWLIQLPRYLNCFTVSFVVCSNISCMFPISVLFTIIVLVNRVLVLSPHRALSAWILFSMSCKFAGFSAIFSQFYYYLDATLNYEKQSKSSPQLLCSSFKQFSIKGSMNIKFYLNFSSSVNKIAFVYRFAKY